MSVRLTEAMRDVFHDEGFLLKAVMAKREIVKTVNCVERSSRFMWRKVKGIVLESIYNRYQRRE